MRCPRCKHPEGSRVVDSRETADGMVIRRRRECQSCGLRFTTYERAEQRPLAVVKRDGRVEGFDRKKLRASLAVAVNKRPVDEEELDRLVEKVEQEIRAVDERRVRSQFIGETAMLALRALDPVAYIRFASVHKRFDRVSQFNDFLDDLKPLEASDPLASAEEGE